ncbi:MAG: SLC13 family permease [Pseudomonadota bacterium]|nr:SLC13 family permease [Pseudomonadota bacterium]
MTRILVLKLVGLLLLFGFLLLMSYLFPTSQTIVQGSAVIVLAIFLWSTALVPSALGALIFLFASVLLSVAPPETIFSGFQAGATWLVFGGLVLGLGVKSSGLDTRLINRLLKKFPTSYTGIVYGTFLSSFLLSWIIPSSSARVALLVPIAISLANRLGFSDNSKGRSGLILASAIGTMTPAFGILPSNVPNMALFGAIESIHEIRLTYGEYFILNFPIMGLGSLIVYPLVISHLFKENPKIIKNEESPSSWNSKEKRICLILVLAILCWITDTIHGISPGWVALGAAIICLMPGMGILPANALAKELDYGPIIFVAGIIGLGSVATYTGIGALVAKYLLYIVNLDGMLDASLFSILVMLSTIVGLLSTMPAQPAIIVSMASELSAATGWSLQSVFMVPVISWSIFPFFYQAPPIVLAVAIGNLSVWSVTRMLVFYMIICTIFLLPLHFMWGQTLGYFKSL